MSVSPFCQLPYKVKDGKNRVIICSITETPADKDFVRVNAKCDAVMHYVMRGLEMDHLVTGFEYRQNFRIGHKVVTNGEKTKRVMLYIEGDRVNEPPTCLETLTIKTTNGQKEEDISEIGHRSEVELQSTEDEIELDIQFKEEFDAPPLHITYNVSADAGNRVVPFVKSVSFQ